MNPAMLKKLQKMQKDLVKAQKELEETVFTGSAGGGMVEVQVKGTKEVLSVKIDPEALDPEEAEMLQDTILLAINDAMRKVDETQQQSMGQFTGGMGIPGLF